MEEEQKDLEKQNNNVKNNVVEAQDDFDDNVATAEEMEAFIRDRREKERHEKKEDKIDIFGEHQAPENSIDPYLEPDPTLPWVKYDENLFLIRGCRKCPE